MLLWAKLVFGRSHRPNWTASSTGALRTIVRVLFEIGIFKNILDAIDVAINQHPPHQLIAVAFIKWCAGSLWIYTQFCSRSSTLCRQTGRNSRLLDLVGNWFNRISGEVCLFRMFGLSAWTAIFFPKLSRLI